MAYGELFSPDGNIMQATPAQQVRDDLSQTLKGVRDSLATSFQTLNLTMSSIHMTLRNMASAMPQANVQPHPSYIPAYGSMNLTGGMSRPMADTLANMSTTGLVTSQRPYNVSGMEFGWQRQNEMNHRFTQFGVDATTHMGGMAFGALGGWGAVRMAGSSMAPSAMRSMAGSGLGRFALGGIGMGIAGMIADPYIDALSNASQVYGRDISGIRRMSTRFGNEFNNHQSASVAKNIAGYGYRELMNTNDFDTRLGSEGYRNVLMQGLQQNMFQGRKPEELVKQMETAASMVKLLTGVMGSKDVQEAMQQIGNLKTMGVNVLQSPGFTTNLASSTYKYSQMMGVPGSQLLQQAAQMGQQAYAQHGMPGFGGIIPAMQNMALSHELEKRRMLSTAEIAAAGGHSALAGASVNLTAGMMQHGGVGKMMLAAGWTGGGNFSMDKFNSAANKGYFPTMHQALAGIAGDTRQYASFMMNQENLNASASEQGGLDGNVKKMLFAALDNMPGMNDENSAGLMIKQIGQSMGINVPTALAKQWAMEKFRPNTFAAMGKEADRHADRGYYFENAQKYHRARGLGEAGEAIEKVPSQMYNYFVTNPAQRMHDSWASFIGEPDGAPGMPNVGAGEFKGDTLSNLRYMLQNRRSPNTIGVNEDAYKEGYRLADRESGLGGGTGFWGSSRLTASRSGLNMAPAIEAMSSRNHEDYFKTILDPNSMSSSEAMARMGKYMSLGGQRSLTDYKNATQYHGKMAGGAEYLADQMSGSSISEITGATRNADWFKNLSSEQAYQIMSEAGIDLTKYDKTSSNELMSRMTTGDNNILSEYAKRNGISTRNLAYGVVNKYMGGDDNMSNLNKMMGSNDSFYKQFNVTAGAMAKDIGQTFGADKYSMQASTGMSIGTSQIAESLKALGLDYEDINAIMDTQGGAGKLQNFGGLVDKLAQGQELSGSDWDSIDNPVLKQRLDKLAKMGPGELRSKVLKDGFLGGEGSLDTKLATLFETAGTSGGLDRVSRGVNDIWGFDASSGDITDAIRSGKFSEFIEGSKGGSKEGKELQSKLREIRSGDVRSLREQYAGLLGDKQVSDADVKDSIRNSLLGTSLETMQKEMDTKPKKGSVESAIEDYGGKGVMRVMMVDGNIAKAEEKLRGENSKPIDSLAQKTRMGGLPQSPVNQSNSNTKTFSLLSPSTWW